MTHTQIPVDANRKSSEECIKEGYICENIYLVIIRTIDSRGDYIRNLACYVAGEGGAGVENKENSREKEFQIITISIFSYQFLNN